MTLREQFAEAFRFIWWMVRHRPDIAILFFPVVYIAIRIADYEWLKSKVAEAEAQYRAEGNRSC